MSIIVPGYKPLLPNEVYVRHDGIASVAGDTGEAVRLSDVLILSRFDEPTGTDIASYLTERAVALEGRSLAELSRSNLPIALARDVDLAICSLPERIREIIADGGKGLMELLADYNLAQEYHRRYVVAMYGVMPAIDTDREAEDIPRSLQWFVSTLTEEGYVDRHWASPLL